MISPKLEKPSWLTGVVEATVDSARELVLEFCPDLEMTRHRIKSEISRLNHTVHCNETVFHHLENLVLKNSSMDNVGVVHHVKKNLLHSQLLHLNVWHS